MKFKTVNIRMFFDTAKVRRAVDKAARATLSKAGAFVRMAARSSIRKRKRISAPGQPPSSHAGLLRRLIFFGYDAGSKSVVIGPMRLNQKIGAAPEALEHGGTSTVVEGRRGKRRKRRIRVKPRPFMGPALQKELPKLPKLWAKSVR